MLWEMDETTQIEVIDLLREWGELTVQELAYLMGCPPQSAQHQCHRLRISGLISYFPERYKHQDRYVYYLVDAGPKDI
ncbi:TPA_asm: hypothetical protein vir515_00052 [Caudoviricetes sp. vir515]|jgi:DNA-binding IclR family transcriptional regulator|nr:TPA_asm: hypothetical protein vir515_00052 [Caudoviricetes sp. vir515]